MNNDTHAESLAGIARPAMDSQSAFISSAAVGPALGPLYYLFLGLPRLALMCLFLPRAPIFDIKHGREYAWAAKSWDSFDDFRARNEQIDRQARVMIIALSVLVGLAIIATLGAALWSRPTA